MPIKLIELPLFNIAELYKELKDTITHITQIIIPVWCCAIFISFAAAMWFSRGHAYMNAYGEGWFEVMLAGIVFVLAVKKK